MPTYRYQAVNASGRKTRGRFAAINESELSQYLEQTGFELIHAKVQRQQAQRISMRSWARRALSPQALASFTGDMAELLAAGFVFIEALEDLMPSIREKPLSEAVRQITQNLRQGLGIAAAFQAYPQIFPAIYTAILASGEASGDLVRTFAYLKDYTETQARLSENLRRALRYPLFLITVATGVVTFMLLMVVPQIILFLQSIDGVLPLSTRWLIAASDHMATHGWILLVLILILPLLGSLARQHSSQAAYHIDRCILKVPVVGMLLKQLALARFIHSFSLLHQTGSNILDSLQLARGTIGNNYLRQQLDTAADQLRHGQSLSMALEPLLPSFAARMLRVGEHSRNLGKSLTDIARSCDRQAAAATDKFIAALEPALTMMVGTVLAWVVVAVFGPIYGSLTRLIGNG